jgi:hypothetical protein
VYQRKAKAMRNGLKVFETCVPRGIFGPKAEEVTEGWRKLHNVELHSLYTLSNIVAVVI